MKTSKILSFETSELLRVEIDNKIYTLKTHNVEKSLTDLALTIDELKELKKLPSNMYSHLIAKKQFNATIEEVKLNEFNVEQTGFSF